MTDEEIAKFIKNLIHNHRSDCGKCVIAVSRDKICHMVLATTSQTWFKKTGEIAIQIPDLPDDEAEAIGLLALVVGRRLERFERGMKSNAGRTSDARQKIAQNAIQKRWSARRIDD